MSNFVCLHPLDIFLGDWCDIDLYEYACMMLCCIWSSLELVTIVHSHVGTFSTIHRRRLAQDVASDTLRGPCDRALPWLIVVLACVMVTNGMRLSRLGEPSGDPNVSAVGASPAANADLVSNATHADGGTPAASDLEPTVCAPGSTWCLYCRRALPPGAGSCILDNVYCSLEHWQKYHSEGTMIASRVASEPKFLQERPDATVETLAAVPEVASASELGGRGAADDFPATRAWKRQRASAVSARIVSTGDTFAD